MAHGHPAPQLPDRRGHLSGPRCRQTSYGAFATLPVRPDRRNRAGADAEPSSPASLRDTANLFREFAERASAGHRPAHGPGRNGSRSRLRNVCFHGAVPSSDRRRADASFLLSRVPGALPNHRRTPSTERTASTVKSQRSKVLTFDLRHFDSRLRGERRPVRGPTFNYDFL